MYDFIDSLRILGEDVSENLIEIVFLGREILKVGLDAIDQILSDDFVFPGGEVDGLLERSSTLVVSETCLL